MWKRKELRREMRNNYRPLGTLKAQRLRNLWIEEVAEREGFEPTVLFRYSRFPGVRLKPLSHLSDLCHPALGGKLLAIARVSIAHFE
ncbi:MAG: hypothetical protein JWM99_4718 [Verrucomicrobiales bacterium]|nr:hypothetical protein [Verrucomicrobiales bacterium]